MADWYEMAAMTTVEFAAALKTVKLGLIPVGATEQHGPNLALGTDYVAAHRLAQRIAVRVHPRAVVTPPLPIGLSYHHTGFSGTLTLTPETFIATCVETAVSLKRSGLTHVLFVNGHNGNTAVLNVATTKLVYEHGMQAAVSFYFGQAGDRVKAHAKTARFGHACEVETSVLLELAPELVRTAALAEGVVREPPLHYAFNTQPFFHQVPIPFDQQTENGVFGDARLANRAAGSDIVETAVERTVAFIDSFIAWRPDRSPVLPGGAGG